MKNYLILLFSLTFFAGFSQNGNYSFAGAKGQAMGGTGIVFQDINGFLQNPAALAHLIGNQSIAAAEQRFILADLSHFTAAFGLPTKSGSFGIVLNYFGFEAYNEQKIGLAYARKFSKKITAGVQFDYLNTHIEEYGNKGVLTFELGFQFQISKELTFASQIFNPIRAKILEDENLPSILKLGLAYQPAKSLTLVAEVEKDIDLAARFKSGLEYQFLEALKLRAGIATNPTSMTFGMGLKLQKSIFLDVASSYHQILGFSPAVSISYKIVRKSK